MKNPGCLRIQLTIELLLEPVFEQIQDALLNSPTKMIEFLLSAINRATLICKSKQNKSQGLNKHNSSDDGLASTETKSLELAMGLLLQYILGKLQENLMTGF